MARLDTGLLVRGEHKIIGSQRLSLPQALIEIEDGTGLFHKQWIARKDPASMSPRTDRVLTEPAPNGGATDVRHESLLDDLLAYVGDREARQGQA